MFFILTDKYTVQKPYMSISQNLAYFCKVSSHSFSGGPVLVCWDPSEKFWWFGQVLKNLNLLGWLVHYQEVWYSFYDISFDMHLKLKSILLIKSQWSNG